MTTTRNKQQVPEITAATLIKDSAECLASVPALIQQANAKKTPSCSFVYSCRHYPPDDDCAAVYARSAAPGTDGDER